MTEAQRKEFHTMVVHIQEPVEQKFQRIADWVDSLVAQAEAVTVERCAIVADKKMAVCYDNRTIDGFQAADEIGDEIRALQPKGFCVRHGADCKREDCNPIRVDLPKEPR